MSRHLSGIDHVIAAVRDLDAARGQFERLGFSLTPRGRHLGRATGNHCIMFASDYVELLGVVDPEAADQDEGLRSLPRREGLCALALASSDLAGTRQAWREAGLEATEVEAVERLMEPDTRLRFEDVMLPPAGTGGVPLFACNALTPAAMREDAWLRHPNGARGIASVTVVVDDPASYADPMGAVFGVTALTDTDHTLAVHTGHGILLFSTADDFDMLHPELEHEALEGNAVIAALSLLVDDLAATAAWLHEQQVPFRQIGDTIIGVAAEHAHGMMLEFAASPRPARALL